MQFLHFFVSLCFAGEWIALTQITMVIHPTEYTDVRSMCVCLSVCVCVCTCSFCWCRPFLTFIFDVCGLRVYCCCCCFWLSIQINSNSHTNTHTLTHFTCACVSVCVCVCVCKPAATGWASKLHLMTLPISVGRIMFVGGLAVLTHMTHMLITLLLSTGTVDRNSWLSCSYILCEYEKV